MLPDRVSNPGLLTYESGALPIALRGPAGNAGSGTSGKGGPDGDPYISWYVTVAVGVDLHDPLPCKPGDPALTGKSENW